tara:strand:+ start:383 stop:775 length:393 start_codon:yes stop_codon:yes gene_type:complete
MQSNQQNTNSVIGKECNQHWKLVEDASKLYFSHPKYKTKKFHIGVIQEFDKKEQKIKKNLYPMSDIENDPFNICFNINNNELIPNKFKEFWNTRRGKRIKKYISYRERREREKKEYEFLNPKKTKSLKKI